MRILITRIGLCVLLPALVSHAQLRTVTYAPGSLAHVPGEPVIINRLGVYPQAIVRTEGPFLLYIQNRRLGHTEHFSLTLDQPNAPELIGLDTTSAKVSASQLLDLLPGTYRVRGRSNPNISFTIKIQQ